MTTKDDSDEMLGYSILKSRKLIKAILSMSDDIPTSNSSETKRNIVIIGGGIIGVCAAYYLAKALWEKNVDISESGTTITILEANDIASGASGKAGGFLAKDWHSRESASLGRLSFELHTSLAQSLGGKDVYGYRRVSSFGGVVDVEDLSSGVGKQSNLEDQKQDEGINTHIVNVPRATPTRTHPSALDTPIELDLPTWIRAADSFPLVADEETTAQVHPYLFTQVLFKECLKLGVRYAQGHALKWNRDGGLLGIISPDVSANSGMETKKTLSATTLIIAAGPWSGRVANELLEIDIPMTYLPGHSIILQPPTPGQGPAHSVFVEIRQLARSLNNKEAVHENITQTPEIFFRPDGTIYVAGENTGPPLPDGTKEVNDIIDPESIAKLQRSIQLLGVQGEQIQKQLCYRPLTRRRIPIIGKLGKEVYIATGHGPWGISLGPGTGKILSELVLDEPNSLSADIFGLEPRAHGVAVKE
ncbi:hypothetical protein Clacol_002274 [Clathrus columnatus]|uniref:FAD dependent oxidoreductase domain-containing protein n=1 Tax=Clathrus columnatus TaxID=1419009 RepID=A0AAV5A3Q1_9AGAM|nr:hypothetical protein Clacol_002274 [Clathrus columnatus]